jgi:aryl-alcohol dehydrogenase-like predicted oxidoreductase
MRLSTDADRDEEQALATVAAAAGAGITVFDTARAYGLGEDELGHNERLLARALRGCGADVTARIVTKGGMARPAGAWVPDGRAKAIRADCEASLEALDGLPIDLYLLHAPDPRTPWRTSVRALTRLLDEGLVSHVGLANVNRGQLDEALELAPVAAVQVALSVVDDQALRGGVVERCAETGLALIAHSPLGGPRRAPGLARRAVLREVAEAHDSTPAEIALAWLLGLGPNVIAIPGARRPETASSAARAASLELGAGERERLVAPPAVRAASPTAHTAEVVLVMGIPGAGKSRVAQTYGAHGHVRLNRDERGGTLRALADELEAALASGGAAARPRQHLRDPRVTEPRDRSGCAPRREGAMRVARYAARAGAGQHGGAAPRAVRLASDTRGAEGGGPERAWTDGADVPDARAARARAAR